MTELPYTTYCDAITDEAARIASIAAAHDLTAKVPSCPDWTLADLVRHVGVLQQWFAAMIDRRSPTRLSPREVAYGVPADIAGYPEWCASRAVEVDRVLRAADPDAAMYTWGPGSRVAFWARRMLMELLVHRHDAELAAGSLTEIDPILAADGVEEFLVNLPSAESFAPHLSALRGGGETVRFATPGAEWTVRLDPESFGLVPSGTPDAAVMTTPEALLLLVYGRVGVDDPRVRTSGDAALLAKWFTHSTF
ncbi:maleylpyruvate isomerase family mycothiol-dependent enzyme [Kutzneria sp. CA-103260]|uniref:maleylpyruvate isomerase family mycothiol-dependent enzyme n=1 Tax=Kutzneria sp. CA-103260 TaxID=2802641 RepID=UPI001BA70241|nr:maleylpyruvate isomerase family mycothiol-dependent enzyme [Kutzneria sp. CA-103260]QUQ65254.1 maleylpyruvate isomerase family mycothiol-dependent enzyme [Kutzneria sp. CA-103260]